MKNILKTLTCLFGITLLFISFSTQSAPLKQTPKASTDIFHPKRIVETPEAPENTPFAEHFAVFHISTGDGYAQKLILNNAQNLQNFYGADKVAIEVVAYGPGLRTLFKESTNSKRIKRMADNGITFSACANTMKAMGRDQPTLHNSAKIVPGGVVRIMELQEAGWTYIRP